MSNDTHASNDAQYDFRAAMREHGLEPPAEIEPGKLHRFAGVGKTNGNTAAWCKLFADGEGGVFGDWSSDLWANWQARRDRPWTDAERAEHRRRVEQARREAQADEKCRQDEAAHRAREIWSAAHDAPSDHPYLTRKAVKAHGLRLYHGDLSIAGMSCDMALIVPMYTSGELRSLQFIAANGEKRFLPGGALAGSYHGMGGAELIEKRGVLLIAEGYATAAGLFETTGYPAAIAFSSGNLLPVARVMHARFPGARMVVCGDDDYQTPGNPGIRAAREAAAEVGGAVAVPDFSAERPEGATDFNDLYQYLGAEAVREQIGRAAVETPATITAPVHNGSNRAADAALDGAAILQDVEGFLGRFVVYPSEHARVAHALWIAHTHAVECWESTPRIAFLSPEPGSGKTRALEISELLVPRPLASVNATSAYMFRKAAAADRRPTILYDEIDTIFGPKAREHEEVRGFINAGHRRGAKAGRCAVHGKTVVTEELEAFCAVAMAGLGNLPDTILTRSIIIRMRRRAKHEKIEPYRRRTHAQEGEKLRNRLAAWIEGNRGMLEGSNPAMPDGIEDRPADVWESLLAVADAAGGDWPKRAREAAVALVAAARRETPSLGVRLLADLRTIFGDADALYTETVLDSLKELKEAPWAELQGKGLTERGLASFLRKYEIGSTNVREGGIGAVRKGYRHEDLHDAWTRYLPPVADVAHVAAPVGEEGNDDF